MLPTPAESSRNLPQVSLPPQMSMVQPPQQPSQHQQFVQSYQQIQDNLNQYRKLANFLEQMEASKRSTKPVDQSFSHDSRSQQEDNEQSLVV